MSETPSNQEGIGMRFMVLAGALALLAGCGGPDQSAGDDRTAATPAACADGSARLPGTGLCQSEAQALIVRDPLVRAPELEGCMWFVNETMLPGDEALLYNAASCDGAVTTLAYAGGAHSAEISYETSALYGAEAAGRILIRLFGVNPDPQGALNAAIAELPAAERGQCEIRAANYEGWPTDALLIAPTAAARARMPQGEPIAACGPMGVNETEQSYWRVRQGFAWFVTLGQEQPDFDAGNMQVIVRGADGSWAAKP